MGRVVKAGVVPPKTAEPGDPILASEWNKIVQALSSFGTSATRYAERTRFIVFNDSGELIPGKAVFSIFAEVPTANKVLPAVTPQKGANGVGGLLVYSKLPIPPGDRGVVVPLSRYSRVQVSTDDTPVFGQECGPTSASWIATSTGKGLLCISSPDLNGIVWAVTLGGGAGSSLEIGKVTTELDPRVGNVPGTAGVAETYVLSTGTYVPQGDASVIENPWSASIPVGTYIMWDTAKNNRLVSADCDTEVFVVSQINDGGTAGDGDGLVIVS